MPLESAIWMSANAAVIEYEDRVRHLTRKGWGMELVQAGDSSNWIHFPVSVPIILDGRRLALRKFFVLYQTDLSAASPGTSSVLDTALAHLTEVHVYDGARKVFEAENPATTRVQNGLHELNEATTFEPAAPITIRRAPSISVRVDFGPELLGGSGHSRNDEFSIQFSCVGMDFEFAN